MYDDDEHITISKRPSIMFINEDDNRKVVEKDNEVNLSKKNSKKNETVKALYNVEFRKKDNYLLQQLKVLKDLEKKKTKNDLEKGVFFELEPNKETREYMEDFINVEQNNPLESQLFILCDGHTGTTAAENTAKELPGIFYRNLKDITETEKESDLKQDINVIKQGQQEIKLDSSKTDNKEEKILTKVEKAIIRSFSEMDQKLKELMKDDLSGCTTNLIYLCWENNKRVIYSGNVGDSRSVLVRQEASLRLSFDHKASDKSEQIRVKALNGIIIRKRLYGSLAVTRSLGDFEMKSSTECLINTPYLTRTEILDTDKFLVMASDGIWDSITDSDLFGIVNSIDFNSNDLVTNNTKNLAKILVAKAMDLGSKDNISCIAIKLN